PNSARDDIEAAEPARQVEIEDHEIGRRGAGQSQRLLARRRLGDIDTGLGREQAPHAGPHNGMVIDDQNFHGAAISEVLRTRGGGSTAVTIRPRPVTLSMTKRPPAFLTRSLMPRRP